MSSDQTTTEITSSNSTKISSSRSSSKKSRKSRLKKSIVTVRSLTNVCEAEEYVNLVTQSNEQNLLLIKENLELKRVNDEQQHRICGLQQKIDDLNDIINCNHIDLVGKGSNLISNKIIELSRRNRHLSSEMEVYRTKCDALEWEITGLKSKLEMKDKSNENVKKDVDPNELELVKEKLKTTTNKLFDVSNQNTNLRNELKLAMKCLKDEIGGNEPIIIQNLVSNGKWRGRAQQILSLQSKVAELTKKIEGTDDDISKEKQHLEFVRKCEVQSLQKEILDLKSTINDIQFKLTATKTRNKNLNDEATAYKIKTQEFAEDKKRLQQEIDELTRKIDKIRSSHESEVKYLNHKIENLESKSEICHTNVSQVMCEVDNKNDLLSRKDSEISSLQRELEEMQRDLREVSGDFLFNCRDLRKHQYLAVLSNLEQEKGHVLDQLEKLNLRLNRERETIKNLQGLVEKQRLKICQLNSRLSKFKQISLNFHKRIIKITILKGRVNRKKRKFDAKTKNDTESNHIQDHLVERIYLTRPLIAVPLPLTQKSRSTNSSIFVLSPSLNFFFS